MFYISKKYNLLIEIYLHKEISTYLIIVPSEKLYLIILWEVVFPRIKYCESKSVFTIFLFQGQDGAQFSIYLYEVSITIIISNTFLNTIYTMSTYCFKFARWYIFNGCCNNFPFLLYYMLQDIIFYF